MDSTFPRVADAGSPRIGDSNDPRHFSRFLPQDLIKSGTSDTESCRSYGAIVARDRYGGIKSSGRISPESVLGVTSRDSGRRNGRHRGFHGGIPATRPESRPGPDALADHASVRGFVRFLPVRAGYFPDPSRTRRLPTGRAGQAGGLAGSDRNEQGRRPGASAELREGARVSIGPNEREPVASSPGPATVVLWRDLIQGVNDRLSPQERTLLDLRVVEGLSWDEIAVRLGGSSEAFRKQLRRARDRVVSELGLQDTDDA